MFQHLRKQRFKRNVLSSDSSPLLSGTLQWTNQCSVTTGCSRPIRGSRHYSLPSHCERTVCFTEPFFFFFCLPRKILCSVPENSSGLQMQPGFCCLAARGSDWLFTIKITTVLPAVRQRNAHVFPLAEPALCYKPGTSLLAH